MSVRLNLKAFGTYKTTTNERKGTLYSTYCLFNIGGIVCRFGAIIKSFTFEPRKKGDQEGMSDIAQTELESLKFVCWLESCRLLLVLCRMHRRLTFGRQLD
jgi:hypothetical protein